MSSGTISSNITSDQPSTSSVVISSTNYNDTELTLGLPGDQCRAKRRFSDVIIDLKLAPNDHINQQSDVPPTKKQVVGWPPIRSYRKHMTKTSDCKYVKVAIDGVPYLRKIDLELHVGYQQLLIAFEDMFSCFIIRNVAKEMKLMDRVKGMEYIPTYEDKDGDWMLVGDVPWEMFVESCKRIRLMKSSETINGSD